MKRFLIFTMLVFLLIPMISLAQNAHNPIGKIVVLAESGHAGIVSVSDLGQRDRVLIRLENINLPKGKKLLVYSGMRNAETPIRIIYMGGDGKVEFEIPNYTKGGKDPIVEHIRLKPVDGSFLELDLHNQWICLENVPDNISSQVNSSIGIVMYPNFPTLPASFIEKDFGPLAPGPHPELK